MSRFWLLAVLRAARFELRAGAVTTAMAAGGLGMQLISVTMLAAASCTSSVLLLFVLTAVAATLLEWAAPEMEERLTLAMDGAMRMWRSR